MEIREEFIEKLDLAVESKNYSDIKNMLSDLHPADAAEVIELIGAEKQILVFRLLGKSLAAETFVEMDADMQFELIKAFSDSELRGILSELYLDDTVDLIEEMPANVVKRILSNTDNETRKKINELLSYPEDSAGSIMTVEFEELKASMSADEALTKIRATAFDKETIYTCYVTDKDRHLIGVISVRELLLAKDKTVGEMMTTSVISANTNDDKEEVTEKLREYGLIGLPVTDNENQRRG